MRLSEPFKSIKRYELECQRQQLYQELKNQLKLEAYDDSPIGHDFVASLEKKVPGIITSFSDNHSFINATPDENKRVVMEAIDSGMALKAGIIVALATLIFKIVSILTNNKDFSKDAPGGGRGSPTYKESANEQAKDAIDKANKAKEEATEAIKANKNSPLHNDEDSPAQRALTIAARQQVSVLPTPEEQNQAMTKPAEVIVTMIPMVDPTGLNSLFAIKDDTKYKQVIANSDKLLGSLDSNHGLVALANVIDTVASGSSQDVLEKNGSLPEIVESWYNDMIVWLAKIHTEVIGSDGNSSDTSFMLANLEKFISGDLVKHMVRYDVNTQDPELFNLHELTDAFESGKMFERSNAVAKFNGEIRSFVEGKSGFEDTDNYKKLTVSIEKLKTNIAYLRGLNTTESLAIADKLSNTIAIATTMLKIFKFVFVQRKNYDSIDTFIATNTKRYTELGDKYEKIVSAFNKDGGI